MPNDSLSSVAIEALRLQNGYAHAIDTRNWDHFRTLFAPDVIADYPGLHYEGMEAWLASFVPMHDAYGWTLHAMTNHVAGEDAAGIWATCYGFVEWSTRERPDAMNRVRALYRDRLALQDGRWVITRRKLDILMSQSAVPVPDGATFPNSVLDLVDVS